MISSRRMTTTEVCLSFSHLAVCDDGLAAVDVDHVAIRVADRQVVARQLAVNWGLRVIAQDDRLTLMGAAPRAGKITLIDQPPSAQSTLPSVARFVLAGAEERPPIRLASGHLVVTQPVDPDSAIPDGALIGVDLCVADPDAVSRQLSAMCGFCVGGTTGQHSRVAVRLTRSGSDPGDDLDHLAVAVTDVDVARQELADRGMGVARLVDAPVSRAAFVHGPAGIMLEYIQHLPGFGSG